MVGINGPSLNWGIDQSMHKGRESGDLFLTALGLQHNAFLVEAVAAHLGGAFAKVIVGVRQTIANELTQGLAIISDRPTAIAKVAYVQSFEKVAIQIAASQVCQDRVGVIAPKSQG